MTMLYSSRFVSQDVACSLEAHLHRLDTHAYLSADVRWRYNGREHQERLFENWLCDKVVLLDWIKRGVVSHVERVPRGREDHFLRSAVIEMEKTIEARRPYISVPLTNEAEEHLRRYRDPGPHLWYEAVINRLTDETAEFDLSLWAYKYQLQGLRAQRDVFFILTDRLDARLRFRGSWSLFDESIRSIHLQLNNSMTLGRIRAELESDLRTLGEYTHDGVDRFLRALFPLLERMLREDAAARGWRTHGQRLEQLFRKLEDAGLLSDATRQLRSLIAKPYRDVISHGQRLALSVGRVVVVTLLDTFVSVAEDLDGRSQ